MDAALADLLGELEKAGAANDDAFSARERRMLNITRDTGELLDVLARATAAHRILEIGTSNGYSTLWLANAARDVCGTVTTVELSAFKIGLAKQNFERSGLANVITQLHDDAGQLLVKFGDAAYDLIFLDSERSEYAAWWPDLRRVLRPGGLLVVDNALSHVAEMAPLQALIGADDEFRACTVPVGKGELLATRIERR